MTHVPTTLTDAGAEVLGRCLPFSISEIEEACPGVSRDMVRLVLRAMKSEGVIESMGKGRGAKWKQVKVEGGN
jgi:predicted transcriptional regulator of viral defense system